MQWFKRGRWIADITFAGMLLFLALTVWVPVSAAGAYEGVSGLASPVIGTMQATPTEDATVTELNKEKLQQEVKQLQEQNDAQVIASNKEKLQHENDWWWNYGATILSSFISTLILVSGALIGFWQWRVNRDDIRAKESKDLQEAQDKDLKDKAEERFKAAVAALGDEKEGTQVGGAILLRSFLHEEDKAIYERYYTQVFDLAVAYLRLPRTPNPPEDPNTPLPLTTLSRALIVVFKEAFPLARSQNKGHPQSLDASTIRLDNAFLSEADLNQVWMRKAFLRNAELWKAHLNGADLHGADLREANLRGAYLRGADLNEANLSGAYLRGANLIEANLNEANLSGAYLSGDLFYKATDLSFAVLSRANLAGAILKDTNLYRVKGLTDEQLEYCKAQGALINEDSTASSSQSPVSSSSPSQSFDTQDSSAPAAQVNTLPPGIDGSNAPSSQPNPGGVKEGLK